MSLRELLGELRNAGIDIGGAHSLAVNVARELKIRVFPENSDASFLRMIERSKAEQDFASLHALRDVLGKHVVSPIEIVRTDTLACGVFPFVEHALVSYDTLRQERYLSQVTDILVRLHNSAERLSFSDRKPKVDEAFGRLCGEEWSDQFRRYVEGVYQPLLANKEKFPQHCDFTYVNLGIDSAGVLRVFDWEDFGAIRYAGFDLATFVFSHMAHGASLRLMTDDPLAFTNKVREDVGDMVLAKFGFTAEQFTQIFPGHLALFFGLKKEFGNAIKRRLLPILTQMMRSERWRRTISGNRD